MINVLIVDDDAMVAELNRRYVVFIVVEPLRRWKKRKSLSSTVKITLT